MHEVFNKFIGKNFAISLFLINFADDNIYGHT